AQSDAAGILEVRQDVDELGAGPQRILQEIDPHPIVVDRYGQVPRLIRGERLESAEVGGLFREDPVARVEEELADEVQSLLGSRGNENVGGRNLDAIAGHMPHQQLARGETALV